MTVSDVSKEADITESVPSLPTDPVKFKRKQVEYGIKIVLQGLGVDLEDENFKDTPARVARAYRELCLGLYVSQKSLDDVFGKTFISPYDGMVVVGPVKSSGICPHHMLPIHYISVLGYIPKKTKLGLSKLVRAIRLYTAQPAMQETVSHNLVEAFSKYVNPEGVVVWIRGSHACMTSRGVNEPDCVAETQDVRGLFKEDVGVKTEFEHKLSSLLRG